VQRAFLSRRNQPVLFKVTENAPTAALLLHGARNVTVCTTVAASYVTAVSHTAGAVAEQAADRKCSKYTELSSTHEFQPVAVESHGPLSDATASFFEELGRKISDRSGELLEAQFLFRRVSMLVQRLNSIVFRETFLDEDDTDT